MEASRAALGTDRRAAHERALVDSPTAHALFVSTDFRSWPTDEPDHHERDVLSNGVMYRRLDLAYYAWLLHRIDMAPEACEAGKITLEAFETMCERFAPVYAWAVEVFGTDAMDRAERETNVRAYTPPSRAHA